MMKRETFEIARITMPVKRRATPEPEKVAALAEEYNESLPCQLQFLGLTVRFESLKGTDGRLGLIASGRQ